MLEATNQVLENTNEDDENGKTAFHFACQMGRTKTVEMLLENSVKFNILLNKKDNRGKTAFHWACQNAHSEIVELLIKKSVELNININEKDQNGRTAFHLVCDDKYRWNPATVNIFLDNSELFGLDLTVKDKNGETGFQIAERHEKTAIINLIKRKMPSIVEVID